MKEFKKLIKGKTGEARLIVAGLFMIYFFAASD